MTEREHGKGLLRRRPDIRTFPSDDLEFRSKVVQLARHRRPDSAVDLEDLLIAMYPRAEVRARLRLAAEVGDQRRVWYVFRERGAPEESASR